MNSSDLDPRALPLAELRAVRAGLQHEDDAVSYVRRLAQARRHTPPVVRRGWKPSSSSVGAVSSRQ